MCNVVIIILFSLKNVCALTETLTMNIFVYDLYWITWMFYPLEVLIGMFVEMYMVLVLVKEYFYAT